ncbi:MAG TPA: hypothetical protein VK840_06420 [Candidatus Dormibacteraeota bacterium]|nr:hypothetical protein [Candidatus Dormibacteraeota bacterium]
MNFLSLIEAKREGKILAPEFMPLPNSSTKLFDDSATLLFHG